VAMYQRKKYIRKNCKTQFNNSTSKCSPLFAGMVFQTNKLNTKKHDPGEFDHCNVKNVRFVLNSRHYPEETQDLYFKNEKYCEAYESLMEYKKNFS